VIWAVMWFFLVYNSPAAHPRISVEEKEYIERALNVKSGVKVGYVLHFSNNRTSHDTESYEL